MKTVDTLMLKLSLMASIFFAVEIIIFYMVSNYYGVETTVTVALAGAGMLAVAGVGAGAVVLMLVLGESKNKVSLWKTFFFILLMEVFMGVGVFMIVKNIPV